MRPGFSTKKVATEYSGRGVGLDVVQTNIRDLGGSIKLSSILGEGTTFQIIIPKS
jgi:two-component system chemotaxis sensor kinase CheA